MKNYANNAVDTATEMSDGENAITGFTPNEPGTPCPHFREGTLLENATLEASRFVQVDYEMAVASALGTIAACCQGLVDVAYPNGHTVPTSLMLMTLVGVSEGKTSLDNQFSRPIREFEKAKDQEYRIAYQRYRRNLDNWKIKEKTLQKELKACYENGTDPEEIKQKLHTLDEKKPDPPKSHRFIYEDMSTSQLLHSLHENLPLAYFLSDEAGKLLMGPAFDDVCQFNSLWSGSEIRIDRRSSESFIVTDARLSANLMLQPSIFRDFLEHKRGRNAYKSGFFARFLVSCPARNQQVTLSENTSREKLNKFHERVLQRLEASIMACQKEEPRIVLKFSGTALETWHGLYTAIMKETHNGRVYTNEIGHAKKLMDNISRVAALVHTFEHEDYADREISDEDLMYAGNIVSHFSGHYMKTLAQEPEIVTLANSMIQTIRKHGEEHGNPLQGEGKNYYFNMSDIKQYAHKNLRETEKFNQLIEFLTDLGHVVKNKITYQKSYVFKETIIGNCEPKIKNGEVYFVRELPKFREQKLLNNNSNDRHFYGHPIMIIEN